MHSTFFGECSSLKKRSYLSQWGFNNSRFGDYLSLIYPNEIEAKNTPDIPSTPPYGVYIFNSVVILGSGTLQ